MSFNTLIKNSISKKIHRLSNPSKRAFSCANSNINIYHVPPFAYKYDPKRNRCANICQLYSAKLTNLRQLAKLEQEKKSNSAIMAPNVTQKSGIFVTNYAKTALASYLL